MDRKKERLASSSVPDASAHAFIRDRSPIEEPYGYLSGCSFSGKQQPYSPDSLVACRWERLQSDDPLQIFLRRPVSAKADASGNFQGTETLTAGTADVEVRGAGNILLDFGAEYAGWLEIDSPDLSGTVTLGVSEYNQPAFVNSGPQSPSKTKEPVRYGETYRLELNDELYEGVRFGFINVTDFVRPFHITGVRLVCQVKPVNYNGSFDCDDEMLNRIWYTAAYDVRVNLRKDYFSAILMDRGDRFSWTGDAYPAQEAALMAFGYYKLVLQNFRFTARHGNGIESYELYWVLSLADYYRCSGDTAGVRSLLTEALPRLDHAYAIYGTNPNLGFFGWDERLGAGFENPNLPENQHAFQMLCIEAWKRFSAVLREIGEEEHAEKYRGYAAEKENALWNDPQWFGSLGLHACADAINAGAVPQEMLDQLYRKLFTDRVKRLSFSPFNQYFILKAMAKANRRDDAVSAILDMFGGQIAYGATAFFENYRPQWNDSVACNAPVPNNQAGYTSLAHPWGVGVLPWLTREVLGIRPAAAGFAAVEIRPHPGRLTRVSGSVPTPRDPVEAAFDTVTGDCRVRVPQGTTASIGIPKAGKTITDVRINGSRTLPASEDADFLCFDGLPSGSYTFQVRYGAAAPAAHAEADRARAVREAYRYDAEFVGEDAETGGSWSCAYGTDGYDLFAYDGSDNDRIKLPEYVEGIRTHLAKRVQWASATDDLRALSTDGPERGLGALLTNDPEPCQETFTMDIRLNAPHRYTVALYFVDWDRRGRRLAVEMFDGETLDMVAPVRIVDDFAGGKYLIYRYDRSVRFRIDQVRGPNAALSGIFFGNVSAPTDLRS